MLTGADTIDDTDDLRSGGMPCLFGGIYAPSTLREFMRALHHGNVRQIQAAGREFLVQLAGRGPLLPGADAVAFLDVESLLLRVYGKQKQGAAFGHTKVGGYQLLLRGLNPLIATLFTPGRGTTDRCHPATGPQHRLRPRRRVAAGRGHDHRQGRAGRPPQPRRGTGGTGRFRVLRPHVHCRLQACRCPVLGHIAQTAKIKTTIATIPDDGWVEIEYPHPIWDEDQQRFVSRAKIAETAYTAFSGR